MTYVCIDLLIILFGVLFKSERIDVWGSESNKKYLFFGFCALTLIFFSGFRGNFTTDYNNYVLLYDSFEKITLSNILNRSISDYPEKGYLFFQYIITNIFHNPLYIFITSSIIIVIANLRYIQKYIDEYFLATLMFVSVGNFFVSFNLVRQIMAVSVTLCASKYLFERKFLKYVLFILVAATIHKSSLIMIPFFFLANIKVGRKGIVIYPIFLFFIVTITPLAISVVQNYYWEWYMTSGEEIGYSWKNVVAPLLIAIPAMFISLIDRRLEDDLFIEESNSFENIELNATFLFVVFNIIGLQFEMAQRFASFFSIYAIGLFCNKIKGKRILIFGFSTLFIIYQVITQLEIPYYFFWDNR